MFRAQLAKFNRRLVGRCRVEREECCVDATFVVANGGGRDVGSIRKGTGSKIQLIVYKKGVPLGLSVDAQTVVRRLLRFFKE